MIYGYIRVSTDKQDCANQKLGIEAKADALGICIDKYIEDSGISGTKEPEERALGGMLRRLRPGDVIICSELSRLGRKMFMIMRILEHCMKIGARLYTVKDGYELGDNIQSKVLAFAFGLSAEIERNLDAWCQTGSASRWAQSNTYIGWAREFDSRHVCGGCFKTGNCAKNSRQPTNNNQVSCFKNMNLLLFQNYK